MSTTPLYDVTSCCMSDNCQTIYYNGKFFMRKVCSLQALVAFFCLLLCQFGMQCFLLCRSQANGNCLFTTFSIAMCGHYRYVDGLRILTAIELYWDPVFYSKHPSFSWLISKQKSFSSIDAIIAILVSHNALDSSKAKGDMFKNEALGICTFKLPWFPFMYDHHVPLIICSHKNAKSKANRKNRLPSNSTINIKSRNTCGQSSIKSVLKTSLPGNKGKLKMNTSKISAVVSRSVPFDELTTSRWLFLHFKDASGESLVPTAAISSVTKPRPRG